MEKKSRDEFLAWAAAQDWFHLHEGEAATGRQDTFLTPQGSILYVQYDLEGHLEKIIHPGPMPMPGPTVPMPNLLPRMDLRGGQFHPGS